AGVCCGHATGGANKHFAPPRDEKSVCWIGTGTTSMNRKDDAVRTYFDLPLYLTSHRSAIKVRAIVVKELLGAVDNARIVDFGCGDGSLSIPLLGPKNSLTLVDLSERMLSLAANRIPEHFRPNV